MTKIVILEEIKKYFNFPRQVDQPPLSTPEKAKFTKAKITNFPKEMTDITALAFMNDKVDKSIKLVDLEILRCDMNSQIIL